ncbi:MAG: hypothetical protein D6782_08690, partial [Alphaproteobacteria bacterium]
PVGDNFGAGMTGGMAFVYDSNETFEIHVNEETVVWQRVASSYWAAVLKDLVERHAAETGSRHAKALLVDWDTALKGFWQVCPKEMIKRLEYPLSEESAAATA